MRRGTLAQALLDEILHQGSVGIELVEHAGHHDQTLDAVGEQTACGVDAAEDHRLELMRDLDVGERTPLDLGLEEDLGGVAAAFGARALVRDPARQIAVDRRAVGRVLGRCRPRHDGSRKGPLDQLLDCVLR